MSDPNEKSSYPSPPANLLIILDSNGVFLNYDDALYLYSINNFFNSSVDILKIFWLKKNIYDCSFLQWNSFVKS